MSEINVDYILALKKNEKEMLFIEEVEISHPEDVLKRLNEYERWDYYDIFDVVRYVDKLDFNKWRTYSYCWPHEYNKSFVRHATTRPYFYMNGRLVLIESDISKWKEDYEKEIIGIKNRIEIEYASKRNPKTRMDRYEYLEYVEKLRREMRKEIEQKQKERKSEIKNEYINEIRRYIYGMCYEQTLSSVKPTSLMYSNENIGWYRPDYKIADNVLVSVRTNFCYGRSAYFHVNLNYKGINILPYTAIIDYYWSNMMDNVRFTMDYEPSRYNWENALSFVEEVSNLIMTDSDRFEKEWIIEKVEKMMEGLKSINDDIAKYYEKQKAAKEKAEEEEKNAGKKHKEDRKIVRYRFVDDLTIKRHKIYEHETLLTIQVDKLSAALALLEDLTAIQNIYSPILTHIETIVQYNKEIVPAITLCRNDLQKRIKVLNEQLNGLYAQNEIVQNEMLAIKNELDHKLEETNVQYQQWTPQNQYRQSMLLGECEKDERYKKLQNEVSVLNGKIIKATLEKNDRESFDKHLAERKEYIETKLNERKTM